jgi:hypothetical protein
VPSIIGPVLGKHSGHAAPASLPHLAQPAREFRANGSILGRSGYMRSISS